MVIRVRLLRVATAAAGVAALGLTFAGTAYADQLGDEPDSAHRPSDTSRAAARGDDADSEDTADSADEDTADEDTADEDTADSADEDAGDGDGSDESDTLPRRRAKEGLYGLDEDPDSMIHNNLDGETESPGFHHDGVGTVEVPRVATH